MYKRHISQYVFGQQQDGMENTNMKKNIMDYFRLNTWRFYSAIWDFQFYSFIYRRFTRLERFQIIAWKYFFSFIFLWFLSYFIYFYFLFSLIVIFYNNIHHCFYTIDHNHNHQNNHIFLLNKAGIRQAPCLRIHGRLWIILKASKKVYEVMFFDT